MDLRHLVEDAVEAGASCRRRGSRHRNRALEALRRSASVSAAPGPAERHSLPAAAPAALVTADLQPGLDDLLVLERGRPGLRELRIVLREMWIWRSISLIALPRTKS